MRADRNCLESAVNVGTPFQLRGCESATKDSPFPFTSAQFWFTNPNPSLETPVKYATFFRSGENHDLVTRSEPASGVRKLNRVSEIVVLTPVPGSNRLSDTPPPARDT